MIEFTRIEEAYRHAQEENKHLQSALELKDAELLRVVQQQGIITAETGKLKLALQISLQQKAQAETALQTLLEDPLNKPTSSMASGSTNEEVEKLKDQIFSLELELRNLKDEHAKEIQGLKESMGMEREERPVSEHREQTTVEMRNTGGDTEETETTRVEHRIDLPEPTDP